MKAVVITSFGSTDVLQIQSRPIPTPADHEVLIRVYAAGVNRPDVFQRKGSYPPPPGAPQDIPGLEVAGVIEKCGAQVRDWEIGDQVCALLEGGGYAEYVTVNSGQCLPIPAGLDYVQAASLPETVFTVWHNVFQRGSLQNGEHFLVHGGSSGIGITAIQLAKAFGARVFATAGSDEKCGYCLTLGAERCINYKNEDFEKELASQKVDVILDMVGGDYIAKNIRLLRPDGRMVFINTITGGKPNPTDPPDFSLVMIKRLIITGSTLRKRHATFKKVLATEIKNQVWPIMESGTFQPQIFATFDLSHARHAHELMESGEHF